MPSSPDLDTAPVHAWQPDELGTLVPAPPPPRRVEDTLAERLALFELNTAAGIPAAVLAPARKAAEAAGYAAGWAVGTREAQRDAERDRQVWLAQAGAEADAGRARIASAVAALTRAAQTAAASAVPALTEIDDLVVEAAFEIAEALVHSSLRDDPNRGRLAVSRALAMIPQGSAVTVSVHPADHAVLAAGDLGPGVTLVADASLSPGDAVAVCDVTVVDARISAGLDRVRALLGSRS